MTPIQSSELTEFWSETLAEELRRFLAKRLHCPETAAELTQETYLRIHQSARNNPPDNARALAYRIAINLANDYQRKLKVRERVHLDIEVDSLAEIYASNTPSPEQTLLAKEQIQLFHSALAELPADCRQAFLLHGIEGLTYPEIANRLNISESMVYKHMARAIKHCMQRMRENH